MSVGKVWSSITSLKKEDSHVQVKVDYGISVLGMRFFASSDSERKEKSGTTDEN